MSLSAKRKAFVEEYLKDFNATAAAERAGYKNPNKMGPRLVKVGLVADSIQQRLTEKTMSADEVLTRLSEMARADISDFVNNFGGIDWDEVRARGYLVKRVRHNKGKNSEIELHDAKDALVWIGKHHKLFTEKVEVVGLEDVLRSLPEGFRDAVRGELAELVRRRRG
jgi:phage terminase small subunit